MIPLGAVMRAASVGQVVESRRPDYQPGELVQGFFDWQDYVATDGKGLVPMRKVPSGVPPNLALSLFGITGPTAYFGVLDAIFRDILAALCGRLRAVKGQSPHDGCGS
jgi:NADPH-dependent curcumin reductase CurA